MTKGESKRVINFRQLEKELVEECNKDLDENGKFKEEVVHAAMEKLYTKYKGTSNNVIAPVTEPAKPAHDKKAVEGIKDEDKTKELHRVYEIINKRSESMKNGEISFELEHSDKDDAKNNIDNKSVEAKEFNALQQVQEALKASSAANQLLQTALQAVILQAEADKQAAMAAIDEAKEEGRKAAKEAIEEYAKSQQKKEEPDAFEEVLNKLNLDRPKALEMFEKIANFMGMK